MPKVKFDLADADDLFEDEGSQQVNEPEDKEPEQQAAPDDDTEQTDTKEEPEKEAAPEKTEEEDYPAPPTEGPSDPAYMLAQARQAMYEQEARNRELAERLERLTNPPDQFEQEERQLTDRRNQLRQQAMDALREGDEPRRQQLMWELQDTEQAILDAKSNRSMREITSLRRPQQEQEPRHITPEQEQYIQTETFKAAYRVTPEESYAMDDAWRKLISKSPQWNDPNVPRWSKMEQALRIVRGGKKGRMPSPNTAMVAGDQATAPKKPKGVRGRYSDKVLGDMARAFEMSVDQYVQMIDGRK